MINTVKHLLPNKKIFNKVNEPLLRARKILKYNFFVSVIVYYNSNPILRRLNPLYEPLPSE